MNNAVRIGLVVFVAGAWAAAAGAADKPAAGQAQVDAIVKSYLAVQQQLAGDKVESVGAEVGKIKESAAGLAKDSSDAKVKAQAEAVAKAADVDAKDLKKAREGFKGLSASVIALVQTAPPSAEVSPALYEANCPMAKAHWLQTSKEIANPYFGKEMLTCGDVERKIEASGKK